MVNEDRGLEVCLVFALYIAICGAAFQLFSIIEQGGDFYPIYVGAQSLISGLSPYTSEVSDYLTRTWRVATAYQVAPVVAYPLPALMIISPLALFQLAVASKIWFSLSAVALTIPALYRKETRLRWFLAVSSLPVFHALVLGTSTVFWLGLVALSLAGFRKFSSPILGALLALLPLKPQVGLIFFLYLAYLAWRERRPVLIAALIWTLVIWSVSLILIPNWISQWLAVLHQYSDKAVWVSLLFPGLLAALLTYGLPPIAAVATLQFCLFPINDLYSCLPLIICWTVFTWRVALLLSVTTWLMPQIYSNPNNSEALLTFVLLPLLICLVLVQLGRIKRYSALRELLAPWDKNLLETGA